MISLSIPFRKEQPLEGRAAFAPGSDLPLVILAHGSTTGMELPLIADLAGALARRRINCLRFNFPFISQHKKTPNSDSVLGEAFAAVLRETEALYPHARVFVAGKSLGARIAAMTASAESRRTRIEGVIFVGYPLHPPGFPGEGGGAAALACPLRMLFLQGTRDAFANLAIMKKFVKRLTRATLHEVAGGDHSLRTSADRSAVVEEAATVIAAWIDLHT